MVGGDFQEPLHLLVVYGYCVFEDDINVDQLDSADGRPTDAIITFLELFVRPCVDQPEVIDEGHDHAAAPYFGVLCWGYMPPYAGVLWGCDGRGVRSGKFQAG